MYQLELSKSQRYVIQLQDRFGHQCRCNVKWSRALTSRHFVPDAPKPVLVWFSAHLGERCGRCHLENDVAPSLTMNASQSRVGRRTDDLRSTCAPIQLENMCDHLCPLTHKYMCMYICWWLGSFGLTQQNTCTLLQANKEATHANFMGTNQKRGLDRSFHAYPACVFGNLLGVDRAPSQLVDT